MSPPPPAPRDVPISVLLRDFAIFHLKLFLDGVKGVVLTPVSITAAVADVLLPVLFPEKKFRRGRFFYALLRVTERFDLWLNLYGAARSAHRNADGLFGESRAGDDTLLGELEELVRKADAPPPSGRPSLPG